MCHVLCTSGIVDAVGDFFSAEPQKCILVGGVSPKDIELDSHPPLFTGPGHKAVLSILYPTSFFLKVFEILAEAWWALGPLQSSLKTSGQVWWRDWRWAGSSGLSLQGEATPALLPFCKGPSWWLQPPRIPKWPLQREFAGWWHQFYENSCDGMIL